MNARIRWLFKSSNHLAFEKCDRLYGGHLDFSTFHANVLSSVFLYFLYLPAMCTLPRNSQFSLQVERLLQHSLRVMIVMTYRVFWTVPHDFQYQNEKQTAANQSYFLKEFSMQKSSWLAKQVLCTENGRTSKNHRVEYYFGIESFFLKRGILMARFGKSWRKNPILLICIMWLLSLHRYSHAMHERSCLIFCSDGFALGQPLGFLLLITITI